MKSKRLCLLFSISALGLLLPVGEKLNSSLFTPESIAADGTEGIKPNQEELFLNGETTTADHVFLYEEGKSGGQANAVAPTSSRQGLALYGLESGAKARFKAKLNGVFEADMLPFSSDKSLALKTYSLLFEDGESDETFAVVIRNYSNYAEAAICYHGVMVANSYLTNSAGSPVLTGYSTELNRSGSYTRFSSLEANIRFDPFTKKVQVKNGDSYLTIWDFSQEYNDGRRLKNHLDTFRNYSVSVVFDQVENYSRGSLLLYSFGGYSLDRDFNASPKIYANIETKAFVGEKFVAPKAEGTSPLLGDISSDQIATEILDQNGNMLNAGQENFFIPASAGTYYLRYRYQENTVIYRIEALERSALDYRFSYSSPLKTSDLLGLHAPIEVPSCIISSNVLNFGKDFGRVFLEKKDGTMVHDFGKLKETTKFRLDETGEYNLVYQLSQASDIEEKHAITVSDEIASLVSLESPSNARLGERIQVKDGTVYYRGETSKATASLLSPSGKIYLNGEHVLDEKGIYTLRYSYSMDGILQTQEKKIGVYGTYESLFKGDGSKATYGPFTSHEEQFGITLSLSDKQPLVYQKKINLNQIAFDENLADLSQNVPLIEMVSLPHTNAVNDAEGLYIVLTDAEDASNEIQIRVKYVPYSPGSSVVRTKAKGQSWVGYYWNFWNDMSLEVDSAQTHEEGGFALGYNFSHILNGAEFANNKLSLYFNAESNRLYGRPWQLEGQGAACKGQKTPWLIRDYSTNDPTLSAFDTPWAGFSSGEVYMSIYASGVNGTADFGVLNIAGEDLTQEYEYDDDAPTLEFALEDKKNPPLAVVGKSYRLPACTAKDPSGNHVKIASRVYSGNTVIPITDGAFTPNFSGSYTIAYTATDSYGNQTTKSLEIEAKSTVNKPKMTFDSSFPTTGYVGEDIALPTPIISDGAGAARFEIKASISGQTQILNHQVLSLTKKGNYVITYTVTDYVGQSTSKSFSLNADYAPIPLVDENSLHLPSYFFAGDSYSLEMLKGYFYSSAGKETLEPIVTVTDGGGLKKIDASTNYVPEASASVNCATITYTYRSNSGASKTFEKVIPVISPVKDWNFVQEYFPGENLNASAQKSSLKFSAKESNQAYSFSFARKILASVFSFSFLPKNSKSLNFTLLDASSLSEVASLSIRQSNGQWFASVNGEKERKLVLGNDGEITIRYDKNKQVITDQRGVALSSDVIFPSDYLYMNCQVTDGEEIEGLTLCNQNLNYLRTDSTAPILQVMGSVSGRFAPGSTIETPLAYAYDVLSAQSDIRLEVRRDGELIEELDGSVTHSLQFETFGEYELRYIVEDGSGNEESVLLHFTIYDPIAPSLTFTSTLPTEAKIGDVVQLRNYIVEDNEPSSVTVSIHVIHPNGLISSVEGDTYTFAESGSYVITYLLRDGNGNYGVVNHKIVVK